jgi:hypothetical protein
MQSSHLELEVSVLGTIYRRTNFFIQYALAAIQPLEALKAAQLPNLARRSNCSRNFKPN